MARRWDFMTYWLSSVFTGLGATAMRRQAARMRPPLRANGYSHIRPARCPIDPSRFCFPPLPFHPLDHCCDDPILIVPALLSATSLPLAFLHPKRADPKGISTNACNIFFERNTCEIDCWNLWTIEHAFVSLRIVLYFIRKTINENRFRCTGRCA